MTRNQYKPDRVSSPGDTLKELLAEFGITQEELARSINIPGDAVRDIIKGDAAITSDVAHGLEQVLTDPTSTN